MLAFEVWKRLISFVSSDFCNIVRVLEGRNDCFSTVTKLKPLLFVFRENVTVAMDLHLLLKLLR